MTKKSCGCGPASYRQEGGGLYTLIELPFRDILSVTVSIGYNGANPAATYGPKKGDPYDLFAGLTADVPVSRDWVGVSLDPSSEVRALLLFLNGEQRGRELRPDRIMRPSDGKPIARIELEPSQPCPRWNGFVTGSWAVSAIPPQRAPSVPLCPQIVRLRLWDVLPTEPLTPTDPCVTIMQWEINGGAVDAALTADGEMFAIYAPGARAITYFAGNNNHTNPASVNVNAFVARGELARGVSTRLTTGPTPIGSATGAPVVIAAAASRNIADRIINDNNNTGAVLVSNNWIFRNSSTASNGVYYALIGARIIFAPGW